MWWDPGKSQAAGDVPTNQDPQDGAMFFGGFCYIQPTQKKKNGGLGTEAPELFVAFLGLASL